MSLASTIKPISVSTNCTKHSKNYSKL
jgi:hypothetical protein